MSFNPLGTWQLGIEVPVVFVVIICCIGYCKFRLEAERMGERLAIIAADEDGVGVPANPFVDHHPRGDEMPNSGRDAGPAGPNP